MSEILRAYLENEAAIKRYVRRFCSHTDDIQEISQETFLKGFALEMKGEVRQPKSLLFRIARNTAISEMRKKQHSATDYLEDFAGSDDIVDEDQVSSDELMDSRRKLVALAEAVATLTPQCRRAFTMRRIDGLQMKQIAIRMNLSVSAVEKHVATGIQKCYTYLRAQGYDPADIGAVKLAKRERPPEPPAGTKTEQARKNDE